MERLRKDAAGLRTVSGTIFISEIKIAVTSNHEGRLKDRREVHVVR
jgi:hypothetical protein